MNDSFQNIDSATNWRNEAGSDNPAGPLFSSIFAEADIGGDNSMFTAVCGTNCTWSIGRIACC